MEHRKNIISELQSISPLVAEIVPVNPYQVPESYFNELAISMLRLVQVEQPSTILIGAANVNPYSVPENYFNNFPDTVLLLVKADLPSEVLRNASVNPYELPQNYFEDLPGEILTRIKAQELSAQAEIESLSPLLSKLDKKVPFSTPEGYFEQFADNTVAGGKALDFVNAESEELSPTMRKLRTENPYAAPAGYFEQLPATVLNKIVRQQPAKVVSMNFGKKVMKYAVAAVVTGIIVIAGILFVNRNAAVTPDAIAQSDEKLEQEVLDNVHTLSDEELSNFVENQTASLPDYLGVSTADLDSDDVKIMLADIPDSELKQYLTEYGEEEQILTN